jgi:hypothetical protein
MSNIYVFSNCHLLNIDESIFYRTITLYNYAGKQKLYWSEPMGGMRDSYREMVYNGQGRTICLETGHQLPLQTGFHNTVADVV